MLYTNQLQSSMWALMYLLKKLGPVGHEFSSHFELDFRACFHNPGARNTLLFRDSPFEISIRQVYESKACETSNWTLKDLHVLDLPQDQLWLLPKVGARGIVFHIDATWASKSPLRNQRNRVGMS